MYDPASNQSDDTQFLQKFKDEDAPPMLWESVEEMQRTGSNTAVHKYITGFIMTQMMAKSGNQETRPGCHRRTVRGVSTIA
jgi:hypothetical protein